VPWLITQPTVPQERCATLRMPIDVAKGGEINSCCRTATLNEDTADFWLVAAMVFALPCAGISWLAFDDADQIRKEWAVRGRFPCSLQLCLNLRRIFR
jgi:hypothetical protein